MARKAEDRPVAVQQPRQAAVVRVPVPSRQDSARHDLAKVIEQDIEDMITHLEELWMPSNVSAAKNHERLAETTRILAQMDAQTKNLVNFLADHTGFCQAYVSILIRFLRLCSIELAPGGVLSKRSQSLCLFLWARYNADVDMINSGEE